MNNILNWLNNKLSGGESTPSGSTKNLLPVPLPTIDIVHPKGMSSHVSFLMEHLDQMDATVEKIRPSSFSSDAINIHIIFPIAYLTGKAYEIYYNKDSHD